MKKLLLVFVLFSLFSVSAQNKENSLIGKWTGKETGIVEFFDNKTARLSMMGKVIPIDEYKIDNSKNPIWADFIIKSSGQTMTFFAIIEFIDSNTIKWELFPMGSERNTTFSNKSIILKKQ